MIGKGKSISHTKASINYGWNSEKGADFIIKQNVVGESPSEIASEFKMIQNQNEKCKRNTLSFVLSPSIEDGQKLDLKHLRKITNDFVKDLKLEEHQAVAFVHNDKVHKHIHLYVNRVDFKGKAYKDNYIGKRAQKAAERVAILNELKTVQQAKLEKQNRNKSIRKSIYDIHNTILNNKPNDIEDYIFKMEEKQIGVKPIMTKDDILQGLRYMYNGENLKASEVHRSMSLNKFLVHFKKANPGLKLDAMKIKNQKTILSEKTKSYIIEKTQKENGKNRSISRIANRRVR